MIPRRLQHTAWVLGVVSLPALTFLAPADTPGGLLHSIIVMALVLCCTAGAMASSGWSYKLLAVGVNAFIIAFEFVAICMIMIMQDGLVGTQ